VGERRPPSAVTETRYRHQWSDRGLPSRTWPLL
jgi:hypothetical protein